MACFPDAVWRYVLIVATVLSALHSFVIFIFGIYSMSSLGIRLVKLLHLQIALAMLILGISSLAISIFGFIGAIKRSDQLMSTFGVLSLLVSGISLIIGVSTYFTAKNNSVYADKIASLYNNTDANSMVTIEKLQLQLECCGPYGPDKMEYIIPSCCEPEERDCYFENAYKDACTNRTVEIVDVIILGTVLTANIACVVFLLGAIIALFVHKNFLKKEKLQPAK